jgi:hypothetical protein
VGTTCQWFVTKIAAAITAVPTTMAIGIPMIGKYAPNPLKSRGLVKGRRNQTDSLPTGDLTTAMLSQNFEKSWSSQTQQRTRLNLRNLNSLFNRENSLFLEKNSLIRVCKFPVPLRREFGCKLLNPRVDQTRKSRWMAGFCKIPC